MPLWSVQGDTCSHGAGELNADNPQTVFINNIPVIDHGPDSASPDTLCYDVGPPHCDPETVEGSPDVFVYNKPVHRQGDGRICGAETIVDSQSTVFVNG